MDRNTADLTLTTLEQLAAETERLSRVPWWEKGVMIVLWLLIAVRAAAALATSGRPPGGPWVFQN